MPNDTSIISTLTNQAPGMVALIIVVLLFLRSIEKRDQLFIDQMNKITDRLAALETLMTQHDTASKASDKEQGDTLDRIEKRVNIIGRKAAK
jgi:hypothetical protein